MGMTRKLKKFRRIKATDGGQARMRAAFLPLVFVVGLRLVVGNRDGVGTG
ncbi:hypothetical protein FB009_11325 [Sinorhizobium medicae]|nr:hypothetical protein [Sinorhizobium medicae]MBO1939129.1 hypothetical protein [Sinorhizobium medicae]TWA20045.1 hypothetical protein FB006_115175 [Sinorhizobium medicae]TWA33523.1 hypothetical protein FB007_10867 [Sinorhizobium medicae]TWA35551.1 hypothetical protein FB009_11325 [Sinorhizobium medicae]TWA47896.1 hypothetical protein FB005_102296 [Sinorhizobium medicae]